jgi:hypothetical protein
MYLHGVFTDGCQISLPIHHCILLCDSAAIGFYTLDLHNPRDRWTAIRLSETTNRARALAAKYKCV